jgi:hypothetical protein
MDIKHHLIDVNKLSKQDWQEINALAKALRDANNFKKDPLKCIVAAFVLWLADISNDYDDQMH